MADILTERNQARSQLYSVAYHQRLVSRDAAAAAARCSFDSDRVRKVI